MSRFSFAIDVRIPLRALGVAFVLLCSIIGLAVATSAAPLVTTTGRLMALDLKAGTFTLSTTQGGAIYHFKPGIMVSLNGQPSSVEKLTSGVNVVVVCTEPAVAATITAFGESSRAPAAVEPAAQTGGPSYFGLQAPQTQTSTGGIGSPFFGSRSPDASSGGTPVLPLDPGQRSNWIAGHGDWQFAADSVTGAGDSVITYKRMLQAPYRISFDIEVIAGMRPRVGVGDLTFANEGYSKNFALYPKAASSLTFDYEAGKKYSVKIDVDSKHTEVSVDGKLIDSRPGGPRQIKELHFHGGDGWSKGTTRYSNIKLIPNPPKP